MRSAPDTSPASPNRLDDACTRSCARCSKPFMTGRRRRRFCSARCRWRAANARHRIPTGVHRRLGEFFSAVTRQLDAGRVAYGDRTFELPVSDIIREAQAELLDNAAYSFIA